MIRYLNGGTITDPDFDQAYGLFTLAHKYDVAELAEACSKLLCSAISINNCLKVAEVASLFKDDVLKKEVIARVFLLVE